jgi:hypothetical protein
VNGNIQKTEKEVIGLAGKRVQHTVFLHVMREQFSLNVYEKARKNIPYFQAFLNRAGIAGPGFTPYASS